MTSMTLVFIMMSAVGWEWCIVSQKKRQKQIVTWVENTESDFTVELQRESKLDLELIFI